MQRLRVNRSQEGIPQHKLHVMGIHINACHLEPGAAAPRPKLWELRPSTVKLN